MESLVLAFFNRVQYTLVGNLLFWYFHSSGAGAELAFLVLSLFRRRQDLVLGGTAFHCSITSHFADSLHL